MNHPTLLSHAPGQILGHRTDGRPIRPIAGGSEPEAPESGSPPAGEPKSEDPPQGGDPKVTDWQAEAAKWKSLSRKHEDQAKANAVAVTELDELKRHGMSDQERAVEEAKSAGRTEAAAGFRSQIGRHAIEAAAAKAQAAVPEEALALMDLSLLVDDAGQVDADKVAALVGGFSPAGATPDVERRHVTPGQGTRSSAKGGGNSVDGGRELYRELFGKKT